jgi:hypothetical protein
MASRNYRVVAPAIAAFILAIYGCSDDDAAPGPTADAGSDGPTGGGFEAGVEGGTAIRRAAPLPSRGSSIALSPDDTRLVVANREAGSVSVFGVDWSKGPRPEVAKLGELAIGAEVSQVVVHPSGDFALALTRVDQKLVRIDDLRTTPKLGASVPTGSEPTGLALTPFGDTAWVANFVDGTVLAVDTAKMTVSRTVDLNATIAASGRLGAGLAGRPALAHPRSIAITNNTNNVDDDEFVYVTDFYAHQKTPLASDGSNADVAKTAVVYRISVKDPNDVTLIELPPMTDMGFKDHKGGVAGCFPNQLLSINIQGSFGYVTSICASPKGPVGPFTGPAFATCNFASGTDTSCPGGAVASCGSAGRCTTNCTADTECGANGGKCTNNVCAGNTVNIKTTVAPAVSIIDLGSSKTIATVNLAKEFETSFVAKSIADDANRRLPLTMMDLAFVPGTVTAYAASKGTDAVFKIDFNATYEASTIDAVGDPKAPFVSLAPAGIDGSLLGRLPTGIAVAFKQHTEGSKLRFAFVNNENTRNVSVLDLDAQDLAGRSEGTPLVVASSALPTDAAEKSRLEGERLFATGLGRWSLKGQGWASCESCHVDALSDNVTWFFPRGARQPNSFDGLFASKDPTDSRIHNWTAIQDEVSDHEMGAIRGTQGGVGAIVKDAALVPASRIPIDTLGHAGLGGSSAAAADTSNPLNFAAGEASVLDDWAHVTAFFKSVRSMKKPTNLDAAKVDQGKALFQEGNCQGCHAGAKWTLSKVFYTPDGTKAMSEALKNTSWSEAATAASFPSALFPAATEAKRVMRGGAGGDFDQIVCAIRPVGTFGVAEPEVGVAELRRDMATKGQGDELDGKGFNVPSLLSMSVGAPYFHAGQARTLEAVLGANFNAHREALKSGFLAPGSPDRDAKVAALIQFVLSIDEDAPTIELPALGPNGGTLCVAPTLP